MAYRFICVECGQWHEGIPDITFAEPHYVHEVPVAERPGRVQLTSDLCVLDDEHFFVRAVLALPIAGTDELFCWSVWSTLSKANFVRYRDSYDGDMSAWEPMPGWLSNRLPDYPDTLALKVLVKPRPKGQRPWLALVEADHPLVVEQREGIEPARALRFAGPFIHAAST